MESLLWTFDDVTRFTRHPVAAMRRWALARLTKLFPDQAGEPLVALLDDPDTYIVMEAARFLAETGDAARYGPVLLDRLHRAQGNRFAFLAPALARLGVRAALPLILDHLDRAWRGEPPLAPYEPVHLIRALETFGGAEVRPALQEFARRFAEDDLRGGAALGALVNTARPADLARLVEECRACRSSAQRDLYLDACAAAVEATQLAQGVRRVVPHGFSVAWRRAAWWLGQQPVLSRDCVNGLMAAFRHQHQGVFPALLQEAHRLVEQRGDPVAEWQAAWAAGARLSDYPWRATFTLLLLETLAAHPARRVAQRREESGLGLALLCQFSLDRDDRAWLDAVEDQTEARLAVLVENRPHVWPGVVDQVADLGPAIVPRLVDLLAPDDYGWGVIRIAEALERIARRHPGSCDVAIPALIALIHDQQGDFLLEACAAVLEAIGPAVVEPVAAHLLDDDSTRQIYLTGVLGEIPTARSAQAILHVLEVTGALDEMHIECLADIGSASAIAPLYEMWEPGDYLLADALLVLCELNGVRKPELPEWRRMVEEQDAQSEHFAQTRDPASAAADTPEPAADPYLALVYEQWVNILMTYTLFADQKPVMLFDVQEQKVYAYPYREFQAGLSPRSQVSLERQYREALAHNQLVVFVRDNEQQKLVSYTLPPGEK